MKSKTVLDNLFQSLSQNTDTLNATLGTQLNNDSIRYLTQKYHFNEATGTINTQSQVQSYRMPFDYSKLKTGTITVGNLRWNPTEITTRRDWDDLNVFPYYSDIPSNFYIYGNTFNLWPIPSTGSTTFSYTGLTGTLVVGNVLTRGTLIGNILSFTTTTVTLAITSGSFTAGTFTTTNGAAGTLSAVVSTIAGNTITYNYKRRLVDLSFADYVTGTVATTSGSQTVTGTGTSFLANYLPAAGSVSLLNLWVQFTTPLGDGEWYRIRSIESATSFTMFAPYNGVTATGISYVIGQMPIIPEDFHDVIVFRSLETYFSSVNKDPEKAQLWANRYKEGIAALGEYEDNKSLNVNLRNYVNKRNPNLYTQSLG